MDSRGSHSRPSPGQTLEVARTYRLDATRKAVNVVMGALLRAGVPAPQKTSYLMTTRGRKSGRERTVPVNLVEAHDDR